MKAFKDLQHGHDLLRKICVILIAAGMVVSASLAFGRMSAEAHHDRLELVVEHLEVVEMARENALTFGQALALYQEAGVTSLFVKEMGFADYGNLLWFAAGSSLSAEGIDAQSDLSYMVTQDEQTAENLLLNLEVRDLLRDHFVLNDTHYFGTMLPLSTLWSLPSDRIAQINSIGLGWPVEDMQTAEEMGLWLQVQIKDWQPLRAETIPDYFAQFEPFERISLVLFNSSNLFGFEDTGRHYLQNFQDVAQQIRLLGVPVGQVEFFRQRGFHYMAQVMEDDVIRVHAISPADARRLGPGGSTARMLLAAKDRNMRSLLARQILTGDRSDLQTNLDYLEGLSGELEAGGLTLGRAVTLPPMAPAPWQVMVITTAVLAGGVLLALRLKLGILGLIAMAGGLGLTVVLLVTGRISLAQKLWALASVTIFPVLAIDTALREEPRDLAGSVGAFLLMTGLSLIGALLMVGLLADRTFMLYLDGFTGVKAAHVLPLIGVFVLYFGRRAVNERKALFREFLDMPLTLRILLLAAAGGAVLLLYVSRTGNEAAVVSEFELLFRNLLERLTGARPRTKEFLIGHPTMLLFLFLGMRLRTTPWLALGTIGQVSIVNTYAHIHTPLLVSLQRSLWGLGPGLILGILLILAWRKGVQLLRRMSADE